MSTAWESSHGTHPLSPPTTSTRRLPYHSHFKYSTLALTTTGDVSHALLHHAQSCTLFTSHPRCLFTSRLHQFHDCPTHLTVEASPIPSTKHASDQGKRVWNEWKPFPFLFLYVHFSPAPLTLCLFPLSRPPRYLVTRVLSSLLFSLLMYIQAYFHAHDQIGSNHRFHQLLQGMTMRGMGQRGGGGGGGGGEGEGKERRLRRKADSRVTFSFLLSFHIQVYWSVGYSSKASEGRRACGGWWYTSYDMEISFLIYFIQLYYSFHFFLSKMPYY